MHLWYQERFGYAIEPYLSSADAIAPFPTFATAVGVRRINGELECCAPFGLDDLLGLVVRPNKRQITRYHLRGESRAVAFYLACLTSDETVTPAIVRYSLPNRAAMMGVPRRHRAGAAGTASRRQRDKARPTSRQL